VKSEKEAGRDIRFVLNAHGPTFENYSMLCISSIIRACPDPLISVYCPRNLPPLSPRALRFYERHEVEIVEFKNEYLPEHLEDLQSVPARHLTLNKIYCLDGLVSNERRLFLDADTIIIRDPRPYLATLDTPIACPPVDTPEAFGGDWRQLYDELNIPFPSRTIRVWERYSYGNEPEAPMVDMVPYFCSGVLFVDGRSSLPARWKEVCAQLDKNLHLIPRSYFLDQIALSAAVQATGEPWTLLSRGFNCHFETLPRVTDLSILHYLNFDALSTCVAHNASVSEICDALTSQLAREDGLNLRWSVMTQWPRWFRRARTIVAGHMRRLLRLPEPVKKIRT
jgi:hypothetical protein